MESGIIYLTHNSAESVLGNMPRLLLYAENPQNIIAIDNASTDDTVKVLKKFGIKPKVNKENIGYTKAINQGLKKAIKLGWDWAVLVNPDIGCLYKWDTNIFSEIPEKAAVVGFKLTWNGEINHAGGEVYSYPLEMKMSQYTKYGKFNLFEDIAYGSSRLGHRICYSSKHILEKVPWVTFACVMINLKVAAKIDLLNEDFFLYNSDSEYCLRVWASGWEVWYNPTEFHHPMSVSSKIENNWLIDTARQDAKKFELIENQLIRQVTAKWES